MPKDFYRSRLDLPMNEKVLNFLSSLEDDLWIVEEDITGTQAHDIMLYEQGILAGEEIKKILISLEKIRKKITNHKLKLDHNFEDIHPFIEKLVIDDIGIEIGGKIHTGRSRNDQISVDLRLKIRDELNKTSEKLIELINVLFKRSEETINAFMPLYTHLQGGQLGVFAHYLNNYVSQILRSLVRIEEIYFRVNFNPLGACSIGGTNIKIDRNRTTELLGFYEPIENSIDAISSRDYIIETLMCLALISVQFSRIAEDLLIWSTKEFQFIELSDEFCSVSSVMPQKKNPDTIEMIRSKCSKLISNLFSALVIVKAIPSGYFRDFQELKTVLRNSFDTLFNIIEMLIGIFDTIQIKEKNMIENINDSYILALDLAEYLVEHHDIPFRVSHEIVANLVKNSTNPRDFLKKREIEALVLKIYNKKIELPDEFSELKKDLDFWLGKRISKGSPSKSQIKETLQLLNQKKVTIMKKYNERIEHIKKSTKIRENLIKSLMA